MGNEPRQEPIDFTFLNRLNEGEKVRVVAQRFGEVFLVRDNGYTEYNNPGKFYFYGFNVEGEEVGNRPRYGIHVWVELDPAAPLGLRDEQIRQKAKAASLMDLRSRLSGRIISLEKLSNS